MEELVIGRYRVTRKLGTGGMAEVYAAKHELMNRDAAIKLLLPEMSARDDIVRRFFQEAQAAARIEHPGIVQVFDVGYTAEGRAYLVMEMLAGEPLGRRLQRHGSLSLEATLVLIRQLAGVIEAAHQRGIIHRDLKPDNLFLVPDPEMPRGERVKVLDFGLAKLLEPSLPPMEQTAQGAVFGTPSFMSPEQCQSAANVDGRTDLYSIGCIFHACLCGQPPFRGNGLAVLMAHVGQAPVPLRRYLPGLPPEIEVLVLRLLEKDPARRPPSCAALIAEIDHAVAIAGIALDPTKLRAGCAVSDAVTIREDPDVRRTLAIMTRGPSALPRTGVRAGSFLAAPTPVADSPGAPGYRPDLTPYPRAASEHDGRCAGRPSSPTIDNGELGAAPAREGSRKLWWLAGAGLLGGLMAAGVIVGPDEEAAGGEPIVLSTEEPRPEIAAAEGTLPELAAARPEAELDHLLAQAERAVSQRAWDDALAALRTARAHEGMDATRLDRVRDLALEVRTGQRHQAALERLRAAGSARGLEKIADAYAEIPADSPYHAEARALFEAAREAWLAERRQRAQRLLQRGECDALAGVAARVSRHAAEAAAEFEAQHAGCVSAPDPAESGPSRATVLARVRAAQASGSTAQALAQCIDAWQIVARDRQLVVECGVTSCKARNRQAARWHHQRATRPHDQDEIARTCRDQGVALE